MWMLADHVLAGWMEGLSSLLALGWRPPPVPCHVGPSNLAACFIEHVSRDSNRVSWEDGILSSLLYNVSYEKVTRSSPSFKGRGSACPWAQADSDLRDCLRGLSTMGTLQTSLPVPCLGNKFIICPPKKCFSLDNYLIHWYCVTCYNKIRTIILLYLCILYMLIHQ